MTTSSQRLRHKLTLTVAALGLVGSMSSCGFDYATNRPNTIANGGYDITGEVHVMGARIVAPEDGTGTFIATLTTDATAEDAVTLDGISGEGVTASDFEPVEIQPHGMVNFATEGGIPVTGDFAAGDAVPLTLSFSNGEEIEVSTIVVAQCHEYADVTPRAEPTPTRAPRAEETTAAADEHGSTGHDAYSCEYPSAPPVGGGEGH